MTKFRHLVARREQLEVRDSRRLAVVAGLVAVGFVAVSVLPLVRQAGAADVPARCLGVPAFRWFSALLLGAVLGSALLAWIYRRSGLLEAAALLAATIIAACLALMFALEAFSTLLPAGVLPSTARRVTFAARAAYGLWILLVAGVALFVALVPEWSARATTHLASLTGRSPVDIAATLGGCAAAAMAVHARYVPWIHGAAGAREVEIQAWATPWLGPLSLIGVWLIVGAAAAGIVQRRVLAAMLGGTGGWLLIFSSGLAILAAKGFGEIRFDSLAPSAVRAYSPHFTVATGAWFTYAVGWVASLSGASFLFSPPESNTKDLA